MIPYHQTQDGRVTLYHGDCLEVMRQMEPESVDCIVTSPPYWGLRRYGDDSAWGIESDWREWVAKMVEWGRECKRVMKPTATMWLNLGDCYAGSWGNYGNRPELTGIEGHQREKSSQWFNRPGALAIEERPPTASRSMRIPAKSLCFLPERVALAFIDELGLICRNKVPWIKKNHMPDSAKDKLTPSWEYIYLFVKGKRYYFEPPRRPCASSTIERVKYGWDGYRNPDQAGSKSFYTPEIGWQMDIANGAKHPDHILTATASYPGRHYAVFPEQIPEFCIKAGCAKEVCVKCGKARLPIWKGRSQQEVDAVRRAQFNKQWRQRTGQASASQEARSAISESPRLSGYTSCSCDAGFQPGLVLDPFCGTGTTLQVAYHMGLRAIGVDIVEEYLERDCKERLRQEMLL